MYSSYNHDASSFHDKKETKLVLMTENSRGDIVIIDALLPGSTLTHPIIDYTKFGINLEEDEEIYRRIMTSQDSKNTPQMKSENNGDRIDYDEIEDHEELDFEEIKVHVDDLTGISNRIVNRSILQDMGDLVISENIKEKANEVYNMLNISTKRGGRRKKVIFFCLHEAHRLMNIPIDPKDLASIVGIKNNDISKAFTMCSPIETGYHPLNIRFTFREFIPVYYRLTGLSNLILDDVLSLADDIYKKDPTVENEFPQIMAAAILMYYMEINGVESSINISKVLHTSSLTLNLLKSRIESIHNS